MKYFLTMVCMMAVCGFSMADAPRVMKLADIKVEEDLAQYPATVQEGIAWLQKTDLNALPLGRQEIDGSRIYANLQKYETKPEAELAVEAHYRYIDVQLILSGTEKIGVVPLCSDFEVVKPYSQKDDFYLLTTDAMNAAKASWLTLSGGELVILTPNDPHAPSLTADEPSQIHKVVVKCLVEEK